MISSMRAIVVLGFCIAVMLPFGGCGGTAIVDPPDGSGGGGAGAGAGGTTSPSAGGVATSGIGCSELCATADECTVGIDCVAACDKRADGPCALPLEAWIACSLDPLVKICGIGPGPGGVCIEQRNAYLDCTGEYDGEQDCQTSAEDCTCTGKTTNGELGTACDESSCACYRDGTLVATCQGTKLACGILSGCCAGVFFIATP
jgi:hypothetical protein